jgi:hypothetical protein
MEERDPTDKWNIDGIIAGRRWPTPNDMRLRLPFAVFCALDQPGVGDSALALLLVGIRSAETCDVSYG